jgi:Ca2+-binding RTX toxin-like protein
VRIFGYPKRYELDYAQGDYPEYQGTCAIASVANLIVQMGDNVSEQQVLNYAIQSNLTVTAQESNDALLRGGTTMVEQLQLLDHFGFGASSHIGFDLELVADKVRAGHGVILGVNGGHLWDSPSNIGSGAVNHTVTVTGVVYNVAETEIVGFYIADSGRGLVTDMTRYVSYADIQQAAQVSSAYFIYTAETHKLWDTNINGTGNSLDNMIVGNDGNNVLNGSTGADSMVGGGGADTYIVDDEDDLVFEDENQGVDSVESSVTFTIRGGVENLTLTGTANLNGTGNALANTITGTSGANTLDGGADADTLVGGAGNDTYLVDHTGDVITETSSNGTDAVNASASYALSAHVENLTLVGSSNIDATGNSLNNSLVGNSGNNILDGGAGADSMAGGTGNDTYVLDDAGDEITENSNEGVDTVSVASTYSIASQANLENITLTGTGAVNATGNSANNVLTGNSGNNDLAAGAGNDTLDGATGVDTMTGGTGDDVYVVDNASDQVVENSSEGTDTIQTTLTYSLVALSNLENLTLTGTADLSATGNDLANVLVGNSGANTLSGGVGNDTLDGGAGIDSLVGGTGNDTYVVDSTSDVVVESSSEGTDLIQSGITLSLASISNVENLTLTGASNVNATGNSLDNVLTGNTGNNILDGGAGNDSLAGGTGFQFQSSASKSHWRRPDLCLQKIFRSPHR